MPSQEIVKQVGGDHYKGDYKHWDLVTEFNVAYLEACATKYLDRWKTKGGPIDLEKSMSYISKRISALREVTENPDFMTIDKYRAFSVDPIKLRKWFSEAHVGGAEQEVCWLLFFWRRKEDLEQAKALVQAMHDRYVTLHKDTMGGIPDRNYTNQG